MNNIGLCAWEYVFFQITNEFMIKGLQKTTDMES
jgi:hypothetical protein